MAGPLEGIRVVDTTAMITGPLATMILADQGADVLKIEPPGPGDVMRLVGTGRGGISSLFATMNRGKRSIVLDLRSEAGRDVAKRLVAESDVFVQNFRPGVIERLGLDEPTLRQIRPDLVYASISAFGWEGPLARRPAYDHILQGLTGVASVQGDPMSGRPEYVRTAFCDKTTANTAAQAITAALFARERGSGGQHVRVSMLDATLSFLWPDLMANHTLLEDDVTLLPPIAASYRYIETADGYCSVAAVTDAQWHGIYRAVDKPELVDDPRFATAAGRSQNVLALLEALGGGKTGLSTAEALERLTAEDVPCGPILRPEETVDHPQLAETGALVESVHPALGRMRQPRPPARFDATPAEIRGGAPRLGEHTGAVLRELGLSDAEIADLEAKGA